MKLIVMRVDKDMSTDECIEHSKKLKQKLGLSVLIVDKKVKEVTTIDIDDNLVLGEYLIVDGKIHFLEGDEK